ncbi:MAG: NAD(+) diphosphatase [Burkholderiales bacterium]|nr:NAD(+) diphosphatase [Burkholderiales bacterium]
MILPSRFNPLWTAPEHASSDALWFVFQRGNLLVYNAHDPPMLPLPADATAVVADMGAARFVGMLGDTPCWAARARDGHAPPDHAFENLRMLFNRLPDDLLAIAGRGVQMLEFDRTHRHCGACATPTEIHEGGRSRRCPACGETYYPKVSPAMMVAIKRDGPQGRELLLARSARFARGMYSALAGFVEPSESIEECIRREAFEEVGVKVGNLRYFASQGWPFPNSLMIAYVADYESGEIVPEEGEIEDAQWFSLDALPQLPHRLSIARRLISSVIAEVAPDHPALRV